jgi:hypothetical protein
MFDRRDPLGYAANQFGSLYAYARMNPVDYVDPMGLDTLRAICSVSVDIWAFNGEALHERLQNYINGGFAYDPEVMAIINAIKALRKGNPSGWRGQAQAYLDRLNSICGDSPVYPGHHFRNLLNSCPKKQPDDSCGDWEKDSGGMGFFHGANTCYRGSGNYSRSQCCYGAGGALDDTSPHMGTYDYTSPYDNRFRHAMDDVVTHLLRGGRYAPGLTHVY